MHGTDDVTALLPAYVAAELDAGEQARVERALAHSAPLRHEVWRYRRLFALLARAAGENIAPDPLFERHLRPHFPSA